MLKRSVLAALAATAALATATAASAAQYITMTTGGGGTVNGVFGNDGASGAGTFTDTFTFTLPGPGVTAGSLTTSATKLHGVIVPASNIDFLSATLDGHAFTLSPTGQFETGSANVSTLSGLQTLVINYRSYGKGATYAGTLSFAPTATPEPGTWGMMLIGLLAVGVVARAHWREDRKLRALEAPVD